MNILNEITTKYVNLTSTIITLVTIGLITVITIIAYGLERRIDDKSPIYFKLPVHLAEGAVLAGSMIILQKTFLVLNNGSVNNGWLYANAQLTILLYAMYLLRNKIILLINLLMPFAYHQSANIQRLGSSRWPYFLISYIFLVAIIIYIYWQTDSLKDSTIKYLTLQILYGAAWWILLWVDHSFPFYNIFNMLIVFVIYMAIIRYCEHKMQLTLNGYDTLKKVVNYDELTGIRNRSSLDKNSKEIYKQYSHEDDVPLSMAMFDIDHFKLFNDKYGHSTGDEVLRHVAHTMDRELYLKKTHGQIFRFGGEEFIIVFRGKTAEECKPIITDLRNTLLHSPLFFNGMRLNVSVSFGISELKPTDSGFADLFNRVDSYLYKSKNAGRNKMTIENVTYDFDKTE
ncbi:GGDEF domain-containing protein [Companilactobacillus sp. HBUAS56275]|uniref:GGDEF domain-containing protein n=1 Tax=Candidatus Companilactobacillus pullicola TaxID=2838523 RepID=A0A9D1ZM86_9LACO|nr:GGDEF domain-containing protein [Candidatus Companilactobacillus pullicola]